MRMTGSSRGARGAAAVVAVLALGAGCNKEKDACVRVVCDFTRVVVSVVDADGEAGTASKVTFTIHPYNDDGEPMTEDELDDAGVDLTKEREAACVADENGDCPTWNAAAGFGDYTISGFLNDEETGSALDTDLVTISLPFPDGQPDECCGYTNSVDATLTLDEDGEVGTDG